MYFNEANKNTKFVRSRLDLDCWGRNFVMQIFELFMSRFDFYIRKNNLPRPPFCPLPTLPEINGTLRDGGYMFRLLFLSSDITFGCHIEKLCAREQTKVPNVVVGCIEAIERKGKF